MSKDAAEWLYTLQRNGCKIEIVGLFQWGFAEISRGLDGELLITKKVLKNYPLTKLATDQVNVYVSLKWDGEEFDDHENRAERN